jgi:hypothetical protein
MDERDEQDHQKHHDPIPAVPIGGFPAGCSPDAAKWVVLVNKPAMAGIYNYYTSRFDAERVAKALDGWVLKAGKGAQAVAERLILYPERDHGSRS